MIAFVRGKIVDMEESAVTVDCGGIGYSVSVSGRDAGRLHMGEEVLLHTHFQVREDAMQLFGFLEREDLRVFRLLLGVNGIGPKAALGILSALSPNDLRFAVLADDIKTIAAAPGIGKKTAQKMILELKDKFSLQDAFEEKFSSAAAVDQAATENQNEAVQALVALGYSGSDALKAVRAAAANDSMSTEDILKAALKNISF